MSSENFLEQIEVVTVDDSNKNVFFNLLDKYNFDLSQYELTDTNPDGLYDNDRFKKYLANERFFAELFFAEKIPVGLVAYSIYYSASKKIFINSLNEFFILHKYRRRGAGKFLAQKIFDAHKGFWKIEIHPSNVTAQMFWKNVVASYSNGNYKIENKGVGFYHDGSSPLTIIFRD